MPAARFALGALLAVAASVAVAAPPAIDPATLPAGAVARPSGAGDQRHPVEARLLVEAAVAAPGSVVSVGVQLVQDEGWHTYWRAPGEIGRATELRFTLPPGVTEVGRAWPLPERFVASDIVSYGYDHEVLHIVDLALPADLAPGPHPLAVEVEWLVCKESCIPGKAQLSTTLTVGAQPAPGPAAPLFEAWRARRPVPLVDVGDLTAEVVVCASPVVPGTPWRTVIDVQPAPGAALAVPADTKGEAAVPILCGDAGLDAGRVVPRGEGFLVVLDATPYAVPADASGRVVGALLQVDVTRDGATRTVRTEALAEAAWAEAGTPVAADDPRCADPAAPTEVAVDAGVDEGSVAPVNRSGAAAWSVTFVLWNLALAFVGGLILNVMPCVLPVLTLKLYGLVDQGGADARERRKAGLAYTLGILASFWALAAAVVVVRLVLGEAVGWGFQMQYPPYVAGVATVVFLFGLSMFGVFEIPAFGSGAAHELSSGEGVRGHFFNGVFATLVATPCSAPFLSTATAFAFQAPTALLVLVFSAVGLGLAAPFLLVAYLPGAYRLLPAPGAWMDTFKQLLGFTLVGTAVWLVGVLAAQIGVDRTTGFLAFLAVASLAAWVFGHFAGVAADPGRQLAALGVSTLLLGLGGWTFLDLQLDTDASCDDGELRTDLAYDEEVPWQPFSEQRLAKLEGRVVFVDFTADWCVSCKVNERTVLETSTVRSAMARTGAVPLQADWTRKDPEIGAWLARYERAGVPLYLVVPACGIEGAVALPEVITPGMVVAALDAASSATCGG